MGRRRAQQLFQFRAFALRAARHFAAADKQLDLRGVSVRVILLGAAADLRGDAAANFAILVRSGVAIVDLSGQLDEAAFDAQLGGAEWIVDALLGTGSTGAPRPPFDAAIWRI